MAGVTTATVAEALASYWETPPNMRNEVPRGEVLYNGVQIIPAKAAVDESKWTLQMDLPANQIYRLVEARVNVFATDTTPFVGFQEGMEVTVSSDAQGVLDWVFNLVNLAAYIGNANNEFSPDFTGADPDAQCPYIPLDQKLDGEISSAKGAARLFLRWVDLTSSTTVAATCHYRFRLLMYDIQQSRFWAMHAPTPVIGP